MNLSRCGHKWKAPYLISPGKRGLDKPQVCVLPKGHESMGKVTAANQKEGG